MTSAQAGRDEANQAPPKTPRTVGLLSGARIPSLDGLRAVSISLVLAGHLSGTTGAPDLTWMNVGGDFANMGVRVFFVISGLLITSLLIDEVQRTGRISLMLFYLRRTFRIFPAYYTLLLVVGIGSLIGAFELQHGDLLHALTYTTNFHYHRAWWVGHTWSLAVEEQFYLLWPAAIALVGLKRAPRVAVAVLVIAPFCRSLIMGFAPAWRPGVGEAFPTIADALAAGCLLAFLRDQLWDNPRVQQAIRSPWSLVGLLALVLTLNRLQGVLLFSLTVGETVENLAIALLVERCVRCPADLLGRLLNSRLLIWIGFLSYSLYLWQQLFLNRHSTTAWTAFPLNAVLVGLAAIASYYLIETPCIEWRKRIERKIRSRAAVPHVAR